MSTSTAKRIQFNRADKDYSAYYDDNCLGSFPTYHAAEVALDEYALDLLEQGLLDTAEGITTMQWQAPRDVVLARPAEVVEVLHSTDPARASVAQKRDEAGAYDDMLDNICADCGAVNQPGDALVDPNDEDGALAWCCRACQEAWEIDTDLTGAPGADAIETTSDAPPIPSASQDGATDATQPAASGLTNPRATLMALLKAAIEEWRERDVTTPYDVELLALARAMAMDERRTLDQICGEALAYAYCKAPGPFLEKFDSFGAPRQAAITHAVAMWMGKTAGEVDRLWVESREMLQNAAPTS